MSEVEEVSVVEVYEIASEIGSECEKLIDLYGSNCVESLIKKCITALEMLENLACKNERETSLIQELNDRISKLENEKVERAETKRKFEKVKNIFQIQLDTRLLEKALFVVFVNFSLFL